MAGECVFVHVLPLPVMPGVSSLWLCHKPGSISRKASPAWAGVDVFWKDRSVGS